MNRDMLNNKLFTFAQELGLDFRAADGCLSIWPKKNGIIFNKVHGNREDCDVQEAELWLKRVWPDILER